jgi:tetratricopeptide (TPR) repeat protein
MEGLAHDAEHAACNHLRTMALTKLGRQGDAVATVDAALRRDPDDAKAHANKGWALLHQSKPRESLEHFRESLRIDPTFEYAKAGIVEALKARNPVYRVMLAYFLYMARLSDRARWGILVGGYFGYQFLRGVARNSPVLAPWIAPVLIAYIVFALLTWFASPLLDLSLRINRFGRYALSRDQLASSNWFGACLLLFVVAATIRIVWDLPGSFATAAFALGMALPLVTIFHCDHGWPRQMMTLFAIAMAILGLAFIATEILNLKISFIFWLLFLVGFAASPWLANFLAGARATR